MTYLVLYRSEKYKKQAVKALIMDTNTFYTCQSMSSNVFQALVFTNCFLNFVNKWKMVKNIVTSLLENLFFYFCLKVNSSLGIN